MFNPKPLKTVLTASIAFLILAVPAVASAKPRNKIYPVPCEKVWKVLETVAKEYYNPSLSVLDNQKLRADLTIGKHGFATAPRTVNVALSRSETGCEVAVDGNFSGLAHNDKGDLFKRIDEATSHQRDSTSEGNQ